MIIYVTKYALTTGIIPIDARAIYPDGSAAGRYSILYKNEFCLSLEEALSRAEEMRIAKIASLKKQIAKLETMEIKVKELEK